MNNCSSIDWTDYLVPKIQSPASRYNLDRDTCKDIHKWYLQKTISFNLENAKILAIDEFSIKQGHKYATVVVDLETKRVIWVGEGKSINQVDEFFRLCGDEGCMQFEAIAMVQSAGFATCVKKHRPKALVVYDLFHIIYNYSRLVISAIRIRLSSDKKIKDDKDGYSLLKKSRILLLTRNSRLSAEIKTKLDNLIDYYHDLYAANELKELLPDVFNTCSKDEAERLWNE